MRILTDLKAEHFYEMAQMEKVFYGDENITPPEQAYEWYRKFPYTVVVAADDCDEHESKSLAGFVNLFPVSDEVFAKLKAGTLNDKDLKVDDIVDVGLALGESHDEPLHMFLSCVVVLPQYRKMGLTRQLLAAAIAQYENVESQCDFILIDNVTEEGRRFSTKYGFAPVGETQHNSMSFIQRYSDFCERVRGFCAKFVPAKKENR